MLCYSTLPIAKDFTKLLLKEPVLVFVEGVVNGRRRQLSIETMLEFDPELAVLGPENAWRVHVRREMGKIVAVTVRIPRARPKFSIYDCQSCGFQP